MFGDVVSVGVCGYVELVCWYHLGLTTCGNRCVDVLSEHQRLGGEHPLLVGDGAFGRSIVFHSSFFKMTAAPSVRRRRRRNRKRVLSEVYIQKLAKKIAREEGIPCRLTPSAKRVLAGIGDDMAVGWIANMVDLLRHNSKTPKPTLTSEVVLAGAELIDGHDEYIDAARTAIQSYLNSRG